MISFKNRQNIDRLVKIIIKFLEALLFMNRLKWTLLKYQNKQNHRDANVSCLSNLYVDCT